MYWLFCANFVDHNNFREKQSCRFGGKLPKKSSNKYLTGIFSTVYLILDTDSYLFSNPVSSMVFHQQMPCRYYQHLICPDTISKYRFQDSCLNSQECALKEDLFVACKQILIISPNCKHFHFLNLLATVTRPFQPPIEYKHGVGTHVCTLLCK